MSSRERFEAWWYWGDAFESGQTDAAWAAWQAAERQALERAIRAAAHAKTTSHACDAIRALIQDASSEKEQ